MICEIEEKKINSHEHRKKYEEIDHKIMSLCEEISDTNIQNKLKNLWQKEVKRAENNSKEYWVKRKKPWWLNRPKMDPYLGKPTSSTASTTGVANHTTNPASNTTNAASNTINAPSNEMEQPNTRDEDMDTDQNFTTTYRGRHRGAPTNSTNTRGQRGNFRGRSQSRGRTKSFGGNSRRGRSSSRGRGTFRGRSASRSRGNFRGRGNNRGTHNYNNNNNSSSVHFFQGRSNHIPTT